MRIIWQIALAVVIFFRPDAVQAAECGPLKLINMVKLQPRNGGVREMIPVRINGSEQLFVFDTGSPITGLARDTADSLKLAKRQGDFVMYDVMGRVSRDQVVINEFSFGTGHDKDAAMPVMERPGMTGGLFGLDYMLRYDTDLDFGTDTLRLFSQDHCPGAVQYWPASVVGVVPITLRDDHIFVPVTVDGHHLNAMIDTGAPDTVMTHEAAKTVMDLTLGSPGSEEVGDFEGEVGQKVYQHTFGELSLGDISVRNARVSLIPDLVGRNGERQQQTGNRSKLLRDDIKLSDMIIGMNILHKLHVYIAFGERRMYISPATAPAMAPAASASGVQ